MYNAYLAEASALLTEAAQELPQDAARPWPPHEGAAQGPARRAGHRSDKAPAKGARPLVSKRLLAMLKWISQLRKQRRALRIPKALKRIVRIELS